MASAGDVFAAMVPSDPGYLKIGDHEFGEGTACRCVAVVKPKAKAKLDKKAADGKSDAITTAKGREPADISIDLSWNRNRLDEASEANHQAIRAALKDLHPRGPKSGKPQEWAHEDADVYDCTAIIIEEIEGPLNTPGTTNVTAKISAASWNKQKSTGASTAKAVDGSKWHDAPVKNPTKSTKYETYGGTAVKP